MTTVQTHLNDVHGAIMALIEAKRPAVPSAEDVAATLAAFDDGVNEMDIAIKEYQKRETCPECRGKLTGGRCVACDRAGI